MAVKHGHCYPNKSGFHRTPTYLSWQRMKTRCFNQNSVDYARYGGRGITVCDRWLQFENFLEDMGARPDGLQLDRIDNNGNYEPSNCRWVSKKENARNRSSCVFIVIEGKRLTVTEWADITGVNAEAIQQRIKRGWDPVSAATEPLYARYSGSHQ